MGSASARNRVAIVGPNGTRYLTLDLALGLLGAVTVPLYATTPSEEIDAILRASRAEVLLVGSPRILADLGPRGFPADRLILPWRAARPASSAGTTWSPA